MDDEKEIKKMERVATNFLSFVMSQKDYIGPADFGYIIIEWTTRILLGCAPQENAVELVEQLVEESKRRAIEEYENENTRKKKA